MRREIDEIRGNYIYFINQFVTDNRKANMRTRLDIIRNKLKNLRINWNNRKKRIIS